MPSRRMERVSEILKQEISKILTQELSDPALGFVTVTEVRPAPDLTAANVYVSVMGSEQTQREALRALERASKRVQVQASARVSLRRFPVLTFRLDDRVKKSIRISALLSDLAREREARESAGGADVG